MMRRKWTTIHRSSPNSDTRASLGRPVLRSLGWGLRSAPNPPSPRDVRSPAAGRRGRRCRAETRQRTHQPRADCGRRRHKPAPAPGTIADRLAATCSAGDNRPSRMSPGPDRSGAESRPPGTTEAADGRPNPTGHARSPERSAGCRSGKSRSQISPTQREQRATGLPLLPLPPKWQAGVARGITAPDDPF